MQEIQLLNLLSKYSVDCVFVAILVGFLMIALKRKRLCSYKASGLFPFFSAFLVYFLLSIIGIFSYEEAISKSFSAGGLATIIYAVFGGFNRSDEDELRELLIHVLQSVVVEDRLVKVTEDIISSLEGGTDDSLTVIKISDLIRANLSENCDEQQIMFYSSIFLQTFNKLKSKT